MDPGDDNLLEDSFGYLTRQVLLFFGAIWLGSTLAAMSCVTGNAAADPAKFRPEHLWDLARGPLFLMSIWLLPNALFLCIMAYRLVASENAGQGSWAVLIGGEAVFAMAGASTGFRGWLAAPVAWGAVLGWALFTWAMLHLMHQRRMRRWTEEMLELGVENELRRLEGGGVTC